MKYTVSSDFTQINSSGGTIQNISSQVIEISNTNSLGSGVLLKSLESISFNGNIFVRCPAGVPAEVRIVPFNASSSSGGSSSSDTTSGGESSGDSTFDADINDMWNNLPDTSDFDSDVNDVWNNP
ncbi:hypothetical protein IKG45_04275 [Candidatus Saccharibacteria bacterium]|nr:hypothetical protein [Candidatus Saccharibacteria bacterium]